LEEGGLKEVAQFATLTDIITKAWDNKTSNEYKMVKGLKFENHYYLLNQLLSTYFKKILPSHRLGEKIH
jgi:hypothetical protein